MDMERRSAMDRTRELPNLKKPRVSEDPSTNSRVSSLNTPLNPRFRTNEREREDSSSYRQQSELIAQYKAALSELTFNSKPIITNLTIIAGENLHAAKGIAATICSNVLEVPSDQKLPSLYLLDSIVKNIGKDYIRHFAARLPEVFCKAYRQVDTPIHNSMRHLFGTWKSVFPPATLQIIEKELGFSSVANGSSGTNTVSRVDSQCPPQSIHVNPKYLEARQRLQQTNSKEVDSDEEDIVIPNGDVSRLAVTGNARQWPDPSSKMHNIQRPQREPIKEPKYEKKGTAISRLQDPRIKERAELEKSYYGRGSEGVINSKNSYDVNHSYGKHRTVGFGQTDRQVPSVGIANKNVPTSNWKNSDEEEYTWDDMNGNNSSIKDAGLQRGQLIPSEKEQPDLHHKAAGFLRPRSSTAEDSASLFEDVDNQQMEPHVQLKSDSRTVEISSDSLSTWPPREPDYLSVWPPPEPKLPVDSQTRTSSRYPGKPISGTTIPFSSSSSTSSIPPLPRSDHLSYSQPSSLGLKSTKLPNSSEMIGQHRHQPSPPPQNLKDVALDNHHPSYSQMPRKPMQDVPSHLNKAPQNSTPIISSIQEEKSTNIPVNNSTAASTETSASDLLAAIMKSGLLPNVSTGGSHNFNNAQPPLPNGPPPSQAMTSSSPMVTPPSLPGSVLPPLPPGPPPSHKSNISSDPNPFSSLLSSLVAKGIIASPATEPPPVASVSIPNEDMEQIMEIPSSASELLTVTKSEKEAPDVMELDELIGVDFKPEIIREFHPLVIGSLFDDLKHQCDICGLRTKTQEQLHAHSDLHSLEKNDELSRKWYSDKNSWVFGDTDFFATSLEEVEPANDKSESMVPADESQCICALCGEPFEDFYCHERDEWMYKGTAYLDSSLVENGFESMNQYLIVHAKCTSSSSHNKNDVAENNNVMQ